MKFFLIAAGFFYSYASYSGPCSRNPMYCKLNGVIPGCALGKRMFICKALPFDAAVCEETEEGGLACTLSAPIDAVFPRSVALTVDTADIKTAAGLIFIGNTYVLDWTEEQKTVFSPPLHKANRISALSWKCYKNRRCAEEFDCSFYRLPDQGTEEYTQSLIQQIEEPGAIKPAQCISK